MTVTPSGAGESWLADLVAVALREDLGQAGDLTAAATIPPDQEAAGDFVARDAGVLAGLDAARDVFAAIDPGVRFTPVLDDGARLEPGTVLASVRGPARAILAAERTALNLLGHLCGVATHTDQFVQEVAGTGCVVRDTRKTLPGLRALEKAAVRAGGGVNHRFGLFDGILVKDNHVAAAGGIAAAARAALEAGRQHGVSVQVEVDDAEELEQALAAGVDSVLCDNFSVEALGDAVARCRASGRTVFVEASGGITIQTVRAVAATGVDAVAVGALTHSSPVLDVGLDFVSDTG